MTGYLVVVDKSTVPVGTAQKVEETIRAHSDHPFDVVSNPEFLKEGAAIDDFMKPDRVVIGSKSERAFETMEELYGPFVRTGKPIMRMDVKSAELTKYAANAMLATRISFMNEIANLCDSVGANVEMVRKGIGSDERIGNRFLFAGNRVWGLLLPQGRPGDHQDLPARRIRFPHPQGRRRGQRSPETGDLQPRSEQHFGGDLKGRRFGIWGLAFKPNTDDMREAPSVVLIESLLAAGATVCACDPEAEEESRRHYLGDRIDYAEKPMQALEGADALILVTEWNEFRRPDFEAVKVALKTPVIFDGRNIYRRKTLEALGFTYYGIGC